MIVGIEGVENFLDDFLIHSKDREQHDRILEKLFTRIREYGFHIRPEKCSFYKDEIRYIGYIINANGIKPDPEKVDAIVKMLPPTDISELRSFLGAANFYGKFIHEIHRIRQPLDDLLKKDRKFVWNSQCQNAFDSIKSILQSDLLLTHYDPNLELIVAGDASKTGIGAIIMHRFPDGQMKAIALRTLTITEQRYSQVEKEALALVFAVTKFRRMLLGRKFILQTDHQPLLKVFGSKKGIPLHTANRLQRWALLLLGFDFNVEYIATDKFGYADVLFRLISNHQKPEEEYIIAAVNLEDDINACLEECLSTLPINYKMVRTATNKDALLQQVIQYIDSSWPNNSKITDRNMKTFHSRRESLSVVNGCIMMNELIVIPECYHQRVLKQLHRGHQGVERTKAIARSVVYWANIDDDIENLVRQCCICASTAKSPTHHQPQPWPRAAGPWKRIHLDYAGPLDGFYYLVVVDSYSKWPEIFQTRQTTSSVTIRFLQETFARFGIPETIVTDNGTQFCSAEFKKMCEQLGIIHIRTAPYHPQSNDQAERFVDTLKRSLRKIVEGEEVPSVEALQTFLQVYRSIPSASLAGKSPSEEMQGRPMRTTLDLLRPSVFNSTRNYRNSKFTTGSTVYAKLYQNADKWIWASGTVVEAIGGVNFNVLLDQQSGRRKLIRSHINQLRPRCDNVIKPSAVSTPFDILVDNFDLRRQTSAQQSANELGPVDEFHDASSTTSNQPTTQPLIQKSSRPTRVSRIPKRLEDYVVG
ncbi:uncharacterized protein K02A2.6-like [Malaya genurostris]|uniref:uncharacterized protein K02A2.6-like n=1 Tax=Malaya genurostris TaxID=325434 RepID=UPI0026F3CAB5|nr:uncharacterized protein K02A2.6-like [Malaya genurostris]